jgi:hypothetical protein
MALNDILTSMDGARDALVTAINAKGGSLAQDATLYQCADAVGSLSGGTSAEYYKCASVTPGVSGAVIEVTGDTTYGCNGTYTIVDATATGKNRAWRTSDGVWEIRNTNATSGLDRWCIFDVASDTFKIRSVMSTVPDNPWEVTSWQNNTSPYAYPDLVLTPTDSTNTWSGYKAVFDSTAGTWSFESDVTEGLAYTSVTPIVGSIYSADALVNVAFLYDDMRNICTAYYKLDGNYRDSVNMYDGIPNKTTFVDGKIGRSAHTNGYSQYISLPNEVSVKGKTQVSYSGWCFIESNPNKDFYIVTEIANSSGYTRAAFGVNASLLPFAGVRTVTTGDTGSFQKVTGTSTISTGTWYFLCAIFDLSNGNITLYVNGVSVGSLNVTASSFVNSNPQRIRMCEFDESGSGNIRVDEVGIWSKALSAAEVSELYNNGAGKSL